MFNFNLSPKLDASFVTSFINAQWMESNTGYAPSLYVIPWCSDLGTTVRQGQWNGARKLVTPRVAWTPTTTTTQATCLWVTTYDLAKLVVQNKSVQLIESA